MKLKSIFFLILFINMNCNFAQEINDSLETDSIKTDNVNKPDNDVFSNYYSKINAEDFNRGVAVSPMQLIQGRVPGFVINNLKPNDPNPSIQMQMRGTSTLYLTTEPLYIIDGIPLGNQDVIPAENIESVEVLKSLSETAPYGVRGGNGVVLITTRRNSPQPLTVTYNMYLYTETYTEKSAYMSAPEWRKLKQDWASSTNSFLADQSKEMIDYNANTNWRREIMQNKLSQAQNLGFFGGYKKTSYTAIFNYNNNNGILQKTGNSTISGQLSVSQLALKDKLQVDLSVIETYRKFSEINNNPYFGSVEPGPKSSNIISIANHYNPTLPVFNAYGNYERDTSFLHKYGYAYLTYNPLEQLANITDKRVLNNTLMHMQASYEIVRGLKFSTSYSKYKTTTKNLFSKYFHVDQQESLYQTNETYDKKERILAASLNYNKSAGFHHFDLLIGYSNFQNDDNSNNTYQNSEISDGANSITKIQHFSNTIRNISGSIKYNYKSKYYLSFGLLKETSPFYTSGSPTRYFPTLSVAWSLGNEGLLTNMTWLNDLKIRAGYGVGQHQVISDNEPSFGSTAIANSGSIGEKMAESNFGIDGSFVSNRICISIDYYNRKTKDGIEIWVAPEESGFQASKINNVEIQNKGWEFYLKSQPLINTIKWTFNFNISLNKNIILSDIYRSYGNIKGQPVSNFYGYQFAGYSGTDRMLVFDKNGNTTTEKTNDNIMILGNGVPKSFFGFTNNFGYKNFDLSIFVRGAVGFEIQNVFQLDGYSFINHKKALPSVDQRDITNYALPETDYFIEKGDYIKIDIISLGYTIPFDKRFIKSAKVSIGCNNAALFTKFTGGNPEKVGIKGEKSGYYYYEKYPGTRIFSLGLKFTI
jgi:TonB-linked SusC/RagA family outer membrane protein